ncbi:hypothetical protein CSW18_14025 [Thermus scotoductus]|uniref:Uncharacterized protein n=1 Tax=Thermus scotoductus TaxID=37636 RepID=A0A430RQH6_THESC|nr:hypothetical protein CSW40_13225 [Thermus scotoductus]RTI33585.1 hypothetical protein CSW18_14025 [Thermus scotoductus]
MVTGLDEVLYWAYRVLGPEFKGPTLGQPRVTGCARTLRGYLGQPRVTGRWARILWGYLGQPRRGYLEDPLGSLPIPLKTALLQAVGGELGLEFDRLGETHGARDAKDGGNESGRALVGEARKL